MADYLCRSQVKFFPGRDVDPDDAKQAAAAAVGQAAISKIALVYLRNINNPRDIFGRILAILDTYVTGTVTSPNVPDDWWVGAGGTHEDSRLLSLDGSAWEIVVNTLRLRARLCVEFEEVPWIP